MENDIITNSSVILGLLAIITLVVRELFAYLKIKGQAGEDNDQLKNIFQELHLMNTNHLHSVEEAIRCGSAETIKTLNDNSRQSIELLARIEGKLEALKK